VRRKYPGAAPSATARERALYSRPPRGLWQSRPEQVGLRDQVMSTPRTSRPSIRRRRLAHAVPVRPARSRTGQLSAGGSPRSLWPTAKSERSDEDVPRAKAPERVLHESDTGDWMTQREDSRFTASSGKMSTPAGSLQSRLDRPLESSWILADLNETAGAADALRRVSVSP